MTTRGAVLIDPPRYARSSRLSSLARVCGFAESTAPDDTRSVPAAAGERAGSVWGVYRFLATPRWLGLAALTILLAVVMVGLGDWQLHRYHERAAINARIDAGGSGRPVPISQVLAAPAGTGARGGPAPSAGTEWSRGQLVGRDGQRHENPAPGRTLQGSV